MNLREAAQIRLHAIDERIETARHLPQDPARRVEVPVKVEEIIREGSVQFRAVPDVVEEDAKGLGFHGGRCYLLLYHKYFKILIWIFGFTERVK